MTTQELKQQIDKVLGNSIRCLLPSYWWKRLFNQVADRIDEVEQSTSQLIDGKVEEVKIPIVESVDELEKLKLAKGRVATVENTGESATVKISDCYFSSNSEEDWSKYTIVKGIEEKDNAIIDKDTSVFFSASKGMITKDAFQVNMLSSGIFYYMKWTDDEAYVSSLEEVNKALSSGKYRAIIKLNNPDDYFTFYLEKPQPSLYIKGDSWERLAKESDLEGADGGSDEKPVMFLGIEINSEESKKLNAEAYQQVINYRDNFPRVGLYSILGGGILNVVDYMAPASNAPEHQYITLIWVDFGGNINETLIYEDGTVVDKGKIGGGSSSDAEIRELYTGDSLTEQQKAWNTETVELVEQGKAVAVVKVKSNVLVLDYLGDNHFYGSTHLGGWGLVLTSVTVKDGIATVEHAEIEADSELSSISHNPVKNWVITAALNNKADKTDIKTINGVSLLGGGNIVVDVDTSNLATKEEVENVISELIDDEEVLAHSLNNLNDRVNNIAGELSGDFASKEEVDSAIETLTNADAANQQAIDAVSGNVSTLTERVDNIASELTEDFATKDEVQTAVDNLTNEVINDEEVLAHAINDLNDRLNEIITRLNNAGL